MHPKLYEMIAGFGPKFKMEDILNCRITPEDEARLRTPVPGLGRYGRSTSFLEGVTSQRCVGLLRFWVMKEYFFALAQLMKKYRGKYSHQKIITNLSSRDIGLIGELGTTTLAVKQAEIIERITHHDTAAAGDLLKILMAFYFPHLADVMDGVHFGNTSEDVMANVFGIITRMLIHGHFMEKLADFSLAVIDFSSYCSQGGVLVLPGLTHLQVAEPTSLSRRFAVRLRAIEQILRDLMNPNGDFKPFSGKLGGAIGNLTNHFAAYPDINWELFAKRFVESLGLYYEPLTDQCVSFVRESQQFKAIAGILDQICKLAEDFIDMVSCPAQMLVKKHLAGAKGSSAMPGKINLWGIEGAVDALEWAMSDLSFLAKRLPRYPFEGNMARSYLMRSIGLPFMHIAIAFDRIRGELQKCHPNYARIKKILQEYPGMCGSTLQTVMKRARVEADAYRQIQEVSINTDDSYANQEEFSSNLEDMMEELNLPKELKEELRTCLDFEKLIEPATKITCRETERIKSFFTQLKVTSQKYIGHEALKSAA